MVDLGRSCDSPRPSCQVSLLGLLELVSEQTGPPLLVVLPLFPFSFGAEASVLKSCIPTDLPDLGQFKRGWKIVKILCVNSTVCTFSWNCSFDLGPLIP